MFVHVVYQVMVATFRCEEIAKEKLSRLKLDEVFLLSWFLHIKVSVLPCCKILTELISYRLGWP